VVLARRPFGNDDGLSSADADNQPVEAMGERLASELLALIDRAGPGRRTWCLTPNS
jgi:hypothetical protein